MSDQTAFDEAQARADEAWGAHGRVRVPLALELDGLMRSVEGVTGLQGGPGADRLRDLFLDFAELHADELAECAANRRDALASQEERDEIAEQMGPVTPTRREARLSEMEPTVARAWLRDANDADVRAALSELETTDEQREQAQQLMKWGRADGNQAQVFAAINEYLGAATNPAEIPNDPPTGGVGATSTFGGDEQGGTGPAEPPAVTGALPLYLFVGPTDAPIDADAWPIADVTTDEGVALYTFIGDDGANPPAGESEEWNVYDGPSLPVE